MSEVFKFAMQSGACFGVGSVGLFGGVESSEIVALSSITDFCPESVVMGCDAYAFGKLACFRMFSPTIPGVLRGCCFSQIGPSVIKRIIVNMVDRRPRLFVCHPFPDNAMHKQVSFRDVKFNDDAFSVAVLRVNDCAGASCIPSVPGSLRWEVAKRSFLPRQFTSFRVVIETLAQIHGIWQFLRSHVGLPEGSLVRAASVLPALAWPALIHTLVNVGVQA